MATRRIKPGRLHPLLAGYADKAAGYGQKRPEEALVFVRKFAEYMVVYVEEWEGIPGRSVPTNGEDDSRTFAARLRYLQDSVFTPRGVELPREKLQSMWSGGNDGAHPPKQILDPEGMARHAEKLKNRVSVTLPYVRDLREWFESQYLERSLMARLLSRFLRRRPR